MDLKNASGESHSSEEDDSRTALHKKILLVEDEAIIALAEAACLKRKGYSVITAPSGEKAIEVVHKDPSIDPAYRQSIVERIHTIQQGGGNPPIRMKILRKDGTSLWTESVSIPMVFLEGQGALVIGRDITATVAMEEKLKREADLHAERLALVEYSFSHTLQEILQKTIDLVCGFTESPIGFFHFITEHSDGSQRIDLMAWSTATLERYCKITELSAHYPFPQAGVWADCARLKRPVIHNDFSKVLGKKGYPSGHPDILRELTVPIIRSGTCIAILGVGNKTSPYTCLLYTSPSPRDS